MRSETGARSNTSFLLSHQKEHVLIDCGASTLIKLKHESIKLEEIGTIIISHFHGDHFGGIPFFLISSLFEFHRTSPLTIIGPPGIETRVMQLQELMYPETSEKIMAALDLTFFEFDVNGIIDIGDKKIVSKKVEHSPPSEPHGIRLEWKDKIVGFSGDTSWTDNLIALSTDADLFICECNFLNEEAFGHLSYKELLSKKNLLKCNNIWISHMGNEVLELENSRLKKLNDGLKIEF